MTEFLRAAHGRCADKGTSFSPWLAPRSQMAVLETMHLRVRGAHTTGNLGGRHGFGPSPRARGSRMSASETVSACGPSPRARGSRPGRGRAALALRSIPACAGLTTCATPTPPPAPVHPRVRGAHVRVRGSAIGGRGPSPRARGSPDGAMRTRAHPRSIPACAGLTSFRVIPADQGPVHPRVRGAHDRIAGWLVDNDGPSPRARGSLPHVTHDTRSRRSIPACAGLTAWVAMIRQMPTGPSPRARGSQ